MPFISASDLQNGRIVPDNFRFISLKQHSELLKGHLKAGDVLIVTRGNGTGSVAWVEYQYENCNINAQLVLLRSDEKQVHNKFLYYFLSSRECYQRLISYASGSAQPQLPIKSLIKVELQIPSYSEQVRIAEILSCFDDKIELNRKMNGTLEAMAQALFKSWFVDFDGVAPEDMYESEMGLIPKGWSIASLDYLATLVTKSISPTKYPDSIFEHYSIPAFDSGRMPVMERGQSIKSNKYVVLKDAILVSKLNPQTARIWLPLRMSENAVCSTEFMQFVPRLREHKPYLYCLMTSQDFQDELLKHVTGSTGSRQRAQPSQISSLSVLQPTTEILFEFCRQIDPILQSIGLNQLEEKNLIKLRDTLLPKLVSGQLRIKDAEKFLESHT